MQPATAPTLAVPVNKHDHILGPTTAKVTLVEYGDFECPYCGQAYHVVHPLLDQFDKDVRFVYRHFPLADLHPHAVMAAEAAEAGGAQRRFWPMYHLIFQNQHALEPDNLLEYAVAAGLDLDQFERDMVEHVHLPRIEKHLESGLQSGVHGTPTFFVDGVYQDLALGYEQLYRAIEEQLREKSTL